MSSPAESPPRGGKTNLATGRIICVNRPVTVSRPDITCWPILAPIPGGGGVVGIGCAFGSCTKVPAGGGAAGPAIVPGGASDGP